MGSAEETAKRLAAVTSQLAAHVQRRRAGQHIEGPVLLRGAPDAVRGEDRGRALPPLPAAGGVAGGQQHGHEESNEDGPASAGADRCGVTGRGVLGGGDDGVLGEEAGGRWQAGQRSRKPHSS